MPELSAEGREEVREFLREERKTIFIAGGVSFGSLILVVGGFLAFLWAQIERQSEAAAQVAANRALNNANLVTQLQEGAITAINNTKEFIGETRASTEAHNSAALKARMEIEETLRRFRNAEDTLKALEAIQNNLDTFAKSIVEDENFRRSFEEQISAVRFPPGSVVAFDRKSVFGACPDGWKLFSPAGGRVIIGAGSHVNAGVSEYLTYSDDPNSAIGGEEVVTLSPQQSPTHRHAIDMRTTGQIRASADAGWGLVLRSNARFMNRVFVSAGEPDEKNIVTETDGGNEPHNNMPPYIALYFCKKD